MDREAAGRSCDKKRQYEALSTLGYLGIDQPFPFPCVLAIQEMILPESFEQDDTGAASEI